MSQGNEKLRVSLHATSLRRFGWPAVGSVLMLATGRACGLSTIS